MNNVTIMGTVSKDGVELRYGGSGTPWVTFQVYESYKPKDGGDRVYSNYDCKMFGEAAERFAESAESGDSVILVGKLSQDKWENSDGEKRSKIVVNVDDAALSVRWNPVYPQRTERSE